MIISERNDFRYEKFAKINIKDRILRFMAKILYQHADHIIAISDGVKRSLIDQINLTENKITTIYNPIYNNKISKLSLCKMPHPWFNLKSYKVILGVGRLTHQKGFDTLIKSFSILNKKIKFKLIILGEGELRDELQKLISKYKVDRHVCLPGFKTNPYVWMRYSDVFVLSSLYEGLGNVLVEAMACGTNVVQIV